MTKNLIILGGGTAGTMMANHLRKHLKKSEWKMTVIDRDDIHYYQPGFLFLCFGMNTEAEITRQRSALLPKGVNFIMGEIDHLVPASHEIFLKDGSTLGYDILIVATGTRIAPEETPGMKGEEWGRSIHQFFTMDGACALREKLASWEGGHFVLHISEMPIKCPVAPLEFVLLADAFFRKKGIRDKVTISYVTPLSGAFTKPKASRKFGTLLQERGIDLVPDFIVEEIDATARKLRCFDGREVPFDLLVTIPVNMGDGMVKRSALGDDLDFIPTHKHTLQSEVSPDVFVLGDATNLPTSKAGSVAHFEAETLADNILRYIHGEPLKEEFDGHSNCFIESGNGKALLIDFNYDIEPHEGKFPFFFGPMSLLSETRINHCGKRAFRFIYWYLLLKGIPLPGISRTKKPYKETHPVS